MTYTGQCFCGDVTWGAKGDPLWSGFCHCHSCRMATASPYTAFIGFPSDHVKISGTPAQRYTSDGQVLRQFCPTCGTQISYQGGEWAGEVHFYAATLHDPSQFQPQSHFFWAEKLPWVSVQDALPKYMQSGDAGELVK